MPASQGQLKALETKRGALLAYAARRKSAGKPWKAVAADAHMIYKCMMRAGRAKTPAEVQKHVAAANRAYSRGMKR